MSREQRTCIVAKNVMYAREEKERERENAQRELNSFQSNHILSYLCLGLDLFGGLKMGLFFLFFLLV
jgi:hypothetical protein